MLEDDHTRRVRVLVTLPAVWMSLKSCKNGRARISKMSYFNSVSQSIYGIWEPIKLCHFCQNYNFMYFHITQEAPLPRRAQHVRRA